MRALISAVVCFKLHRKCKTNPCPVSQTEWSLYLCKLSICVFVSCICVPSCSCLRLSALCACPQGSVCEDWTTVYCCYPLAVCQMIREMKWRMKTQTYHVSTTLECSWRNSRQQMRLFVCFGFVFLMHQECERTKRLLVWREGRIKSLVQGLNLLLTASWIILIIIIYNRLKVTVHTVKRAY